MWMLPLYLHVNQKSVDDDDDEQYDIKCNRFFFFSYTLMKEGSTAKATHIFSVKNFSIFAYHSM